jgi:homoserine dehydrogenase
MGAGVGLADIPTNGITTVTAADMDFGATLGCTVKLIAFAQQHDGNLYLSVTPTMVPLDHALAHVNGATNAVFVHGDPCGQLVVQGAGAGGPETASAVVGDVVELARLGGHRQNGETDVSSGPKPVSAAGVARRHYVRMQVTDQPGVLAAVASAFSQQHISIEQVLQMHDDDNSATLVLTTHPATGTAIITAVDSCEMTDVSVMPILDGAS